MAQKKRLTLRQKKTLSSIIQRKRIDADDETLRELERRGLIVMDGGQWQATEQVE